ncbi:MAG: methyltransferase domain-containing protein [Candidatus Electrothrix sp. AR3]|nr:methyltransferase domain-containing protein [Candidatus Electrothrix sp. AR3]
MDEQEIKELFKNTFNTVADGYDHPAIRFFSESAKNISSYLNLEGNEHVLDVATGTGCAALAVVKDLPHGHVTGIDFSKGMLSQAIKKKMQAKVNNVTFIEMDMQEIDFPDAHFDIVMSAFSIFFIEDMKKQLLHMREKVKYDGKIIIITFYENTFSPLIDLFLQRLKQYAIEPPVIAWRRVATQEQCISLFKEIRLDKVKNERLECGYYIKDASDWWYIIWNVGLRGLVDQLSPNELVQFKKEHLAEVQELASDQGIWLEMSALYTVGTQRV